MLLHLFLHFVSNLNNVFSISFSDLDDTLYPFSLGINLSCRKNIQGELRHYSFFVASWFMKNLLSTNVEEPANLKIWPPDYMRHHLLIEESQIAKMCLDLYKEYGTTMAGLKVTTHISLVHWVFTNYNDLSYISFPLLITPSLFSAGIRLWVWQWWVSCKCSWYLTVSQSEARPCFEDPPTFNSTEKNSMRSPQFFYFLVETLNWHAWKKWLWEHFILPT